MSTILFKTLSILEDFVNYTTYGVVPGIWKNGKAPVPKNSFYKAVHYIDKFRPDKFIGIDIIKIETEEGIISEREIIEKMINIDNYVTDLPPIILSEPNIGHREKEIPSMFANTVLSYIFSTIIWIAALLITPLVWVVDKVASKFSKVEEPEAHEGRGNEGLAI